MVLRVAPGRMASHHEWMWDALSVDLVVDSQRVRRTKSQQGENILRLDQLVNELNGLSRNVAVVFDQQHEVSTSYATIIVDCLQVGVPTHTEVSVCRQVSRHRGCVTDPNFGVSDARVI